MIKLSLFPRGPARPTGEVTDKEDSPHREKKREESGVFWNPRNSLPPPDALSRSDHSRSLLVFTPNHHLQPRRTDDDEIKRGEKEKRDSSPTLSFFPRVDRIVLLLFLSPLKRGEPTFKRLWSSETPGVWEFGETKHCPLSSLRREAVRDSKRTEFFWLSLFRPLLPADWRGLGHGLWLQMPSAIIQRG